MPKPADRSSATVAGWREAATILISQAFANGGPDRRRSEAVNETAGRLGQRSSAWRSSATAGRNCPARRGRRAVLAGRAWLAAAAFLVAAGLPLQPTATPLQAHRAVYAMTLASTAKRSDVIAAEGRMVYRFAHSCDGWTVENRTQLRLGYEGGRDVNTLWTFTSWESLDGLQFHFHARYEQDGQTIERLDGEARLEGRELRGKARFTRPEERSIDLPAGAVFPTEHVRLMIDAAERGSKTLAKVVFDGASADNPYYVHGVFGPLPPAAAQALAGTAGLPPVPSWWTRMAFFPAAGTDPIPEFEISADYRSDGIADHVVQHFREFALSLRLRELEVIPPPDC
ncbi:MAG: cell envelope integrity EipB family protein [Rhodospirillales bacterium]|jgi:hypothetical protein|nr:cell envelope integrity EipB family protein [Rhodospirillales bacterium]